MKKLLAFLLALTMCLSLCACGEDTEKEPEASMSTENFTIDGICVDDSYRDDDESPIRLVHLFYTITATEENLSADSQYMKLTINGTNTYEGQHIPKCLNYASNYYYSDFIEDVYVGSSLKVVTTFEIPEGDLTEGKTVTLADDQIPGIEQLSLTTDDFKHFNSEDEICKTMDPEGYAVEAEKQQLADEETAKQIQGMLNGYYWEFYVNYTWYHIEFTSDSTYYLETSLASTTGTYVVKVGYVSVTTEGNTSTVDIPYEIVDGELTLDCATAYSVFE